MPARKKPPASPKKKPLSCKPGEFEINGKCYRLYLISARVTLPRGADCGISRAMMIDVGEKLGKPGKPGKPRKKRK